MRQLNTQEIAAIRDFLHETEDSTISINDAPLLEAYMAHQKKMLEILDKYKKEDYSEKGVGNGK